MYQSQGSQDSLSVASPANYSLMVHEATAVTGIALFPKAQSLVLSCEPGNSKKRPARVAWSQLHRRGEVCLHGTRLVTLRGTPPVQFTRDRETSLVLIGSTNTPRRRLIASESRPRRKQTGRAGNHVGQAGSPSRPAGTFLRKVRNARMSEGNWQTRDGFRDMGVHGVAPGAV